MADKTKGLSDLAADLLQKREEVLKETEIVPVKGRPGSPTAAKIRDLHRSKVICYMKAIGFKNKDIASSLGCTVNEIYRVLKSQFANDEIERIQREIFVTEPSKMFEAILPQAVKIAVNAMMSKKVKPNVRVDAAFRFMDRALGKPSQQVEVSHNLIKDLIQKMDQAGSEASIEADFDLLDTENKETS